MGRLSHTSFEDDDEDDDLPPEATLVTAPRNNKRPPRRNATDPAVLNQHDPGDGVNAMTGADLDPGVTKIRLVAASPTARRLRVESVSADGVVSHEGYLPESAGEDDLIRNWPRAGTFYVQAVTTDGTAVGGKRVIVVSPTNQTLREIQAAGSGPLGTGAVGADGGPVFALLHTQMAEMRTVYAHMMKQLEEERAALKEQLKQIAERELTSTTLLHTATASSYEGILRTSQDLTAQQVQNQSAILASINEREAMRADAAAERQRAQHAADMERLAKQAELEHMRLTAQTAAERERLRMEQEAHAARLKAEADDRTARMDREREHFMLMQAEAERRREEEYRERRERDERLAKEEREWRKERDEALEKLRMAKDPLGTTMNTVAMVGTVLSKFGMDPAKLVEQFIGGGAGSAGLPGIIADVVKEGLRTVQTVVAANAGVQVPDAADDDDDEPEAATVLPQIPMQPQPQPQPPQPQQAAPQPAWPSPWGQPTQQPTQPQPPPQPVPAQQPHSPLDPATMKRLRARVAQVLTEIEVLPESEWAAPVVAAFTEEPHLEVLFRVGTIRGVLRDVGTDEAMIQRVVSFLDAHGIVADVPRG